MEEILELKDCLLNQQYDRAFAIVEELEAMGRQDKINNLESFLVILLIHLIKIQVEKRVTRSWKNSLSNSLLAIQKRNRLGNKSHYIKENNWDEHISNCQLEAIFGAAKEVFEGIDYQKLEKLVDFDKLIIISNELLALTYGNNPREIVEVIDSKFPINY
ncbi:MAG TPA: DUF29 family protein [Coleofasciculaceae cyanobacterium]|jgi:hypothetical protein